MPTKEQVIEKYGKELWDKMTETGWLDGITISITPDGKMNIPQSDIDRAYRAVKGEYVSHLEMD